MIPAPEALEGLEEVAGVMLGPFEHQVLEQVGEPALAPLLVLRPDVIPEVDGHHRQQPLPPGDHVEAVAERGFREAERVEAKRAIHRFGHIRRKMGAGIVTKRAYRK